jgi:hypothetical protein
MGKTYRAARTGGPLQSAPVIVSAPTISGTATLGQTLTCNPAVWAGHPQPRIARQWIRGAATTIAGATGLTYVVQAADQATTVKVQETPTNDLGSAAASTSAPTGTIP